MIEAIRTVGVLGFGVMGFRHRVSLRTERLSNAGLRHFGSGHAKPCAPSRSNHRAVEEDETGFPSIEIESVKKGLVPAASLSDMASAALVTEAVSESGKTKKIRYTGRLRETGFTGVLTTNTSSLTRASLLDYGEYPTGEIRHHALFQPGALHPNGRGRQRRHKRCELCYS